MANGLREIADTLDVAVSTVSRALSGKPGVSDALRVQIRELAAAKHVMPDPQAQMLRSGKNAGLTILMRMWDFRIHTIFNEYLFERGREVFGSVRLHSVVKGESLDDALHHALAFRPAAIIIPYVTNKLARATIRRIREQKVAVVGIEFHHPSFDAVMTDYAPGMRQVVKLLLDSDCQNAVFMSSSGLQHPDSRLSEVLEIYRELGRSTDEVQVHSMDAEIALTYQKGYDEVKRLLAGRKVDGLFCFNDELAIGALHALAEAGIQVPEQTKVVGFDNIPEAAFARVPLTTVNKPIARMADTAIELCRKRQDKFDAPPQVERIPTSLVVRASAPLNTKIS